MDRKLTDRGVMAGFGLMAGLAFYLLYRLGEAELLAGRQIMALGGFSAVFFNGLLAMMGPLRPARAVLGALGLGLVVTGLLLWASFRFATFDGIFGTVQVMLALLVLALVPLPFWIAISRSGWRDYPVLFGESWGIVVRFTAGWAFVGVVWAVIFLSDALLKIVGLPLIDRVLDMGPTPWLITGAVFGLGLAVVQEYSDFVSPYLLLRLLRLLLPVVLVVVLVFLLALPLRGFAGLFGEISVALTLLAMAGAGAMLVTTAIDQHDGLATQNALMMRAAQGMAAVLPLLAGLGCWAVWLRVAQYGWTPNRVVAAEIALLGLGYGGLYLWAVIGGANWMKRIRRANIHMALIMIGLCALSLTPVINPERIAAQSLLARVTDGRMPPEQISTYGLQAWGVAGAEVLAKLTETAKSPGQEALAQALAATDVSEPAVVHDALLAEVTAILPVQPPGATATRDILLATLDDYDLGQLRDDCRRVFDDGAAGCVLVVADFLPAEPGEEGLIASRGEGDYLRYLGLSQGTGALRGVAALEGVLPQYEDGLALIRAWQLAVPALEPAPINRIVGVGALLLP